ncbi:nitroreductase family protein [Maricurvus nonylphenolicus]|uniref:nitroreductase family protein n=1 Tax=Maricurvus nonylphenolicus TaxID=1008307 RepID=UPI0036F24F5B
MHNATDNPDSAEHKDPVTEVIPQILTRRSSRAIDPDKAVSEHTLERLFEAARWAPSAFNGQPWAYAVATTNNPELLSAARDSLAKGNSWALKAPVLMFSLSYKKMPSKKLIPNWLHKYEAGMATGQMALQAAEEGLVFHQMLGFNPFKIRKIFNIPRSYSVLSAIAIGYPGSTEELSKKHALEETHTRTRKAIEDFSFIDSTCVDLK